MALVNSAYYDINEDGTYKIGAEIINPAAMGGSQESGGGKSPAIIIYAEGDSVPEAIRNKSISLERNLFGGQNQVRFYTERFAKNDIIAIQDYLMRDILTDENPLVVVIKGDKPELIYSTTLGLSDLVGDYISSLSKTQEHFVSKSVFVETLAFVKDYYTEGKQPVSGVVEIVEDDSKPKENADEGSQAQAESTEKKYKIKYEGLAAFKDKKLVGYMDGEEARSYNFVTNQMGNSIITLKNGENMTALKVDSSKSDIKTTLKDESVTVDVTVKISTFLIQAGNELDITKAEALKIVEKRLNEQLEEEITSAVKKAQREFESDIFGFGAAVHVQHPKQWRELKDDWDKTFSEATVNVTVESSIGRTGQFKEPLEMELN